MALSGHMDLDVIVVDSRFSGHDEKNEVDILIPILFI